MSARSYTRRQLMAEISMPYVPINAALFAKTVAVTLPFAPTGTNWEFEGAVARHSGTPESNTALYRFITYTGFNTNNTIIAFYMQNTTTFRVSPYTRHGQFFSFTVPSTTDSKIVFSAKTSSTREATVNGETKTASLPTGTNASNRNISIGDYYIKQMAIVFWYFKAKQNGVVVHNYVPARRKKDGVIGIWDKVTNGFYLPNSGTLTEFNG